MKLRIEPVESWGKHCLEVWSAETGRWVVAFTGYLFEVEKLKIIWEKTLLEASMTRSHEMHVRLTNNAIIDLSEPNNKYGESPGEVKVKSDEEIRIDRLQYLEDMDRLRQEAGITMAMLRDGRARRAVELLNSQQPF